jgi:threonine dehydrogenase-like Zn-dependent dehydrogenase
MKTNQVWYLTAAGQVALLEEPLAALAADEVLVEVEACGLCMLDYKLFTGQIVPNNPPYPHPHGHEAVGRVAQVGSAVTYCRPGDRVGAIAGFALARHVRCKERQVARLPAEGDPAVLITEPLTCVVQFVNNLQFSPGQTVAMFGLGYMGLLILQMLPRFLGRVFVVEPRTALHALAREFGADECLDPTRCDAAAAILQACPAGVDIAIDACGGIKSVCEATPRLLKRSSGPGGSQWGFFSSPAHPVRFEVDIDEAVARGIRFVNSSSRDRLADHRTAATLLAKGAVRQERLITHRFGFDQVPTALARMAERPDDWVKGVMVAHETRSTRL